MKSWRVSGFKAYVDGRLQRIEDANYSLLSDGVTEAESAGRKLFGDRALLKAFANAVRNSTAGVREWVEGVCRSVVAHTSGAEQNDDITMLAITYRGNLLNAQVPRGAGN